MNRENILDQHCCVLPNKNQKPHSDSYQNGAFWALISVEYEDFYLSMFCNTSILPSISSVIFSPNILAING